MKNLKGFFLLSILIIFTACPKKDFERPAFDIYNNSNQEICTYVGNSIFIYPDTALIDDNILVQTSVSKRFLHVFYRTKNQDTLSLFILSADTVNKYTWEEIRESYNILARYDLDVTYEGLKKYNFEFSYPPDEKMKDVKMYPPYSSYK